MVYVAWNAKESACRGVEEWRMTLVTSFDVRGKSTFLTREGFRLTFRFERYTCHQKIPRLGNRDDTDLGQQLLAVVTRFLQSIDDAL